ncbi:glycosyltransferase family 4 protein [Candidatus Pacearchaeota archaeon]|jgi:glycosyltransferase involved in cell wall biosynthesis|nr:glycosyltransferase family 4 protein [Candidatus Pacearchaeota archaeon]
MKIALITDVIYPFTLGGSEIRNYEIAKRLVKKGHEVHIYGAKLWDGEETIKMEGIVIHGVSFFRRLYTHTGKRDYSSQIKLSIRLFFELLKEDFDIIDNLSFVFLNCYSTKLVSIIKKVPLVFTWNQYFGDYLINYFGKIIGIIGMVLEYVSTKLTKNNVAISNFVKLELMGRGIKKENVEVIYSGADIDLISKIKVKGKKFDLIFVGRLNYQKNLELLVNSVDLLRKDFPKIKICIVGDGEEKNNLLNLIKKYKLEKNFYFVGALNNKENRRRLIFEYMKLSKIFVLPSLLEGFPLTIIEANACGLPVITTKTKHNNTSEYIKNNKNGILVSPTSQEFSRAISYLLKNDELRKNMSKIGTRKAKDFSWDKIAEKLEEYYKKVISKN